MEETPRTLRVSGKISTFTPTLLPLVQSPALHSLPLTPPFGIYAANGLNCHSGNLLEVLNPKFQSTAQKVVGSTSQLLILCKTLLLVKLRALAAARSRSALLMSQRMSNGYRRSVKQWDPPLRS